MLFSTKAEYGVRLMVELGRQPNTGPISLNAVAEAERLPLSYLCLLYTSDAADE